MRSVMKQQAGFTALELLVVVVSAAILLVVLLMLRG
jgi:Tfp pilus assembly protein FimT